MDTQCTAPNCATYAYCKGFCRKHYARLYKHKDVTYESRRVDGHSKHPLYKVYHAMLQRCTNPKNEFYSYYGGRGITVCDRWKGIDGFSTFLIDMGERPRGLTLERVDNMRGYGPDNCQWATHRTQQLNRRKQSNNTSGHIGVNQYPNGKWTAAIYVKGKKKHLGYFDTKEQAILAREQAL